jgi:serine/threonine-protein kinase
VSSTTIEEWQRVSDGLDRALDLEGEARESFLATLATDAPGTASQVRELLAVRERQGFDAYLADSPPLTTGPAPAASLIGRHVGPYVIEAHIGYGGMGSVWRAHRADGRFEGYVAIKFVHLSAVGSEVEQRFELEGQLLARLNHPAIARLIDAGVLDGQPYLVIEYVQGEPIDAYCERTALDLAGCIGLFLAVLEAVAHAHSHLIVHRDLKPSNVLVTADGAVKLLDFGIAKLLDGSADAAAMTRWSARALTPLYAAPEQLRAEPVTTATDVYALGVLLYRLLTGTHPFAPARGSLPGGGEHEGPSGEAARPSRVAGLPAARRNALAGDLDNIIGKALKVSPAERYGTVAAFAEDLRRYLQHQPVQARPDTVGYRLAKFVRRNRAGVASGLLVALGLIGTSVFAVLQMLEARAQRDLALSESKRDQAQADLVEFIVGDSLGQISNEAMHERLDRARQFIATRFRREPLLAGRLLEDISGRYIDIGDYGTAAAVIREAEAIGERAHDPRYDAELACVRAEDLSIAGDRAGAHAKLAIAQASLRRLRTVSPDLEAECATAKALVLEADGDFAAAIPDLRASVKHQEAAGLQGTSRYTSTANTLARAYQIAGVYRQAWEIESRNLALVNELGRTDTAGYFAMVSVACTTLRGGGQPLRGSALIDSIVERAHESLKTIELPDYLEGCRLLNEVASGARWDAESRLRIAVDAAAKAGIPRNVVTFRIYLVRLTLERGDLTAAEAYWNALAPVEADAAAAGNQTANAVPLQLTHARLDLAHGQVTDARRRLTRMEALLESRGGASNRDARELQVLQAAAAMAAHDYSGAETRARRAVELARASAVDPGSSLWVGEALVWRARAEAAVGDKAGAATSAREALKHLEANADPAHPLIGAARALLAQNN